MPHLPRFFLLIILLFSTSPVMAAVEVARSGDLPVTIPDVYLQNGTAYVGLDELLAALKLRGEWDSVAHVYRLETPRGTAIVSPGSQFLRLGQSFQALSDRPRFIDGRLRVPEDFIVERLPDLLGEPIHYRNLDPSKVSAESEESPLDRLFAFLLRKKEVDRGGKVLRGIVLDPGHGGQDAGAFGPGGEKEKTVALEVSRRLEKLLKMRLGIPVYLSRDGDYHLSLQQRLEPAGRPDADALILLHTQASFSPQAHGIVLMVRPQEEQEPGALERGEGGSMRLARHLGRALQEAGLTVAGIVRAPLLPLGRGNLPTVLVELGYLSNPLDRNLLTASGGQDRLAEALYAGIRGFTEDRRKEAVQ